MSTSTTPAPGRLSDGAAAGRQHASAAQSALARRRGQRRCRRHRDRICAIPHELGEKKEKEKKPDQTTKSKTGRNAEYTVLTAGGAGLGEEDAAVAQRAAAVPGGRLRPGSMVSVRAPGAGLRCPSEHARAPSCALPAQRAACAACKRRCGETAGRVLTQAVRGADQ